MEILRTAVLLVALLTCTKVVLFSLLFLFNKQEDTESSMLVAQLLFLPTQSNPCSYVPILWNIPCSYMKNFLTCVRSWAGAFQKYWAHNQSSGLPLGTMGIWKQTRISSWCFIHIKVSKESQNSHNKLFHHLWLADSYMVPPIPSATKFLVNIFKLCSSFISSCLYFCLYLLTTLFHCFSHHLDCKYEDDQHSKPLLHRHTHEVSA